MRIYNGTYKELTIDWANVTLPIAEGSPMSADGVVANNSDAIGLCTRYVWHEPLESKSIALLIGGDVILPEVESAYGTQLTDDAIASMGGINFYEEDGTIDKASGGGGGGGGMVLTISQSGSDTVLDKNYNEIKGAVESGIIPIALHTDSDGITEFLLVTGYGFYEEKYFVDLSPMLNTQSFTTYKSDTADGVLKLFE